MEATSSLLTYRICPLLPWSSPLKEKTENKNLGCICSVTACEIIWKYLLCSRFPWLDHSEVDNCPVAGQASALYNTLGLSPWSAENIPRVLRLRDGGYSPHGWEPPAAISTLLWLRCFTGQSSQTLIHTQKLFWSCRWSRRLPPEARCHKFLSLPSQKSSFPTLISWLPARPSVLLGAQVFCVFSILEKNQPLSLWTTSEPASELCLRPAAKWVLHSTCWKGAWFPPTRSQLEKEKLEVHADQEWLEEAVRACWKLSFPTKASITKILEELPEDLWQP